MGYPPLLLSDKISTSYLLPLLALRLLTTSVFCLAFDKSSKAIDYSQSRGHHGVEREGKV